MSQERKAKVMVVSGVGLFVLAIVILLLFVLPVTPTGSPSVQAQPPSPSTGPGAGGTPMGGAPPDERLRLMGPGMPGPGGMPGMAGFEAMGAMVPEAPDIAKGDPIESSRPNPFASVGVVGVVQVGPLVTAATTYGPLWSHIPITARLGFVRPERPERPSPPEPPPPTAKKFLRISSIAWVKGTPTATYETIDDKYGTVQPGDWVDEWQIIEIGQDYVIAKNRDTGEIQRVFLKER